MSLRQILVSSFDEEETRTLCYDLDVDYDSLPGRGKEAKPGTSVHPEGKESDQYEDNKGSQDPQSEKRITRGEPPFHVEIKRNEKESQVSKNEPGESEKPPAQAQRTAEIRRRERIKEEESYPQIEGENDQERKITLPPPRRDSHSIRVC